MSPAVANANLLYNPGFELTGEAGHTDGWSQEWNNNIFGVIDNPHSGTWGARNLNDGGMYQDVAITGGDDYKVTGWIYIPSGIGGSPWGTFMGVKFLRANQTTALDWEDGGFAGLTRDQYNMGDSGWITAPSDAVTARVRFGTWSNAPNEPVAPTDFDDFSITAIPEPSSIILMLTGLTGLFGLSFKKRK